MTASPKAAYRALQDNPDLEFEHYLTDRLKLGTVAIMRAVMGSDEYERWKAYVGRERQREEMMSQKGR